MVPPVPSVLDYVMERVTRRQEHVCHAVPGGKVHIAIQVVNVFWIAPYKLINISINIIKIKCK